MTMESHLVAAWTTAQNRYRIRPARPRCVGDGPPGFFVESEFSYGWEALFDVGLPIEDALDLMMSLR